MRRSDEVVTPARLAVWIYGTMALVAGLAWAVAANWSDIREQLGFDDDAPAAARPAADAEPPPPLTQPTIAGRSASGEREPRPRRGKGRATKRVPSGVVLVPGTGAELALSTPGPRGS